jgi:hypothetical protein
VIGYARGIVVDRVLVPQSDKARGETRAFLDPDSRPLDVEPQELDLLAVTTRPLEEEIGGGMTLRHEIGVALVVQHGRQSEAVRLRDAIALELVLRFVDVLDGEIPSDPATGQYVTGRSWSIDYRPLIPDTPNEAATISFVIDTQLDR